MLTERPGESHIDGRSAPPSGGCGHTLIPVSNLPASSVALQLRLLGPLEARLDGVLLAVGGPRQRALLALLALAAGTPVPVSELIDLLWDEAPPPTAVNTVQVYISRLRRLLTGKDGVTPLRTVAGMYLLDLPPDAVDVRRFEFLAAAGRARLADGDPVGASAQLRAALQLWPGPALPDLEGMRAGQAAVARLESIRLGVLADRIEADALLGRHAILVPELEALVRRHPLDERFVAQLMTALYRDGRQAEAFAAHTALAGRLAQELGVDPGPDVRELHTRILRQDTALSSGPAPSPTVASPQQRQRVLRSPPAAATRTSEGHSPAQNSTATSPAGGELVGRRAELAEALALIIRADVRLVTLFGPGGVGKTRLADAIVAALISGNNPNTSRLRVVFVPLAALTEARRLSTEILQVLAGQPDWLGEPTLDIIARELGGEQVLLVLDNLEQLVDGDLSAIDDLLRRVSCLTVLATSRTVLRLPGERVLALGPLPVPAVGADADHVLGAEAVQLFQARARAVLPSFEVTAANADSVAALCRSLDGLPLALELAAARVRVLPPGEILRRLDRRMELLAGGTARLPERQRSMWAALDWSAQLLDPTELLVFGQLSVFAGGWTLAAAEQVCGPDDPQTPRVHHDEVVDVLARLVDKSLVVANGSGRLSMLETVRDYARQLLAADPALASCTRDRHVQHYAALAEQLGPLWRSWLNAGSMSPRDLLDRERANLAVVLEIAASRADQGEGELLGRLVTALLGYWFSAGRLREADRWVQAARRTTSMSPALRARLLLELGNLALVGGDPPTAAMLFSDAHTAAVQLGDTAVLIRSSSARALAARYLGALELSRELLEGALDILPARSDVAERDNLERALENEFAEVLDELGRSQEAIDLWQEGRRWALATDNPGQLAYPLINLARVALEAGDRVQTEALMQQALDAATASDSAPVLTDLLGAAGLLDYRLGNTRRASARLRRAVRLAHDCGQLLSLPEVIGLLGASLVRDDPRTGARLLAAARAWQAERSIAAVSRSAQTAVADAETWLLTTSSAVSSDQLAAERQRGASTPFGSMRRLYALDPGLRADGGPETGTDDTVIDLREQSSRRTADGKE